MQGTITRKMMVDIETLDTARTSVVIQVAAIVFDMNERGDWEEVSALDIALPVEPQVKSGRTVSPSTIAWWLTMDRHEVFSKLIKRGNTSKMSYQDKIQQMKVELGEFGCKEYWFQGPTFDAIILEDLIGDLVPWKFYQVRDQRTADSLALDQATIKEMKKVINHDALEDVRNQISRLSFCLGERCNHG
tara:strand:- start:43282 stop:43848 length:567 start_codon:yes stop_codon:yes gene_type:complete